MRRREVLPLLIGAAAWPLAAQAQPNGSGPRRGQDRRVRSFPGRALFRASEAWLDANAASAYGPLPPRSIPWQRF